MGSVKPIYIRVPRTASGTFLAICGAEVSHVEHHWTAVEWREREPAAWASSMKFGFIRNPWDWAVSVYNSGIGLEPWPGSRIEPGDRPGIHRGQRTLMSFREWLGQRRRIALDWLTDTDGDIIVDEIRCYEDFVAALPADAPRENEARLVHYREWYDNASRLLVASRCAREIRIGGYEF